MKRELQFIVPKLKDGEFIEYWHTGNIRKTGTRKNGLETGKFYIYFDTPKENQKLWGKGEYKEGVRVGCWETYYYNGQLETLWKYENGKIKDGAYPFYDEVGVIIGINEYKNHKLYNGILLLYWPDGSVRKFKKVKNYKQL